MKIRYDFSCPDCRCITLAGLSVRKGLATQLVEDGLSKPIQRLKHFVAMAVKRHPWTPAKILQLAMQFN